ncbi:hypothetical protein HPB51_026409 [Rhipicephalus microplus]|uniref:Uncharacterized protein n=1 Tax=Rhipicephalus microplus TaxID=6941 RepID=A0A9J6D364_RHIMP|nr:hypothetical protein HPB51_026409 [Rhipicephalus microplus]
MKMPKCNAIVKDFDNHRLKLEKSTQLELYRLRKASSFQLLEKKRKLVEVLAEAEKQLVSWKPRSYENVLQKLFPEVFIHPQQKIECYLVSFADRETTLVKNIMTHLQVKITPSDEFFRDESARGVKLSAMDGKQLLTREEALELYFSLPDDPTWSDSDRDTDEDFAPELAPPDSDEQSSEAEAAESTRKPEKRKATYSRKKRRQKKVPRICDEAEVEEEEVGT